MTHRATIGFLSSGLLGGIGCLQAKESVYTCDGCVNAPEALAADDGRPSGIYKGVFVCGEISGNIRIEIATDHSSGSMGIRAGGVDYAADQDFGVVDAGDGITEFQFEGTDFVALLWLESDGDVRIFELDFAGCASSASLEKETSTELVRLFEGVWYESSDPDFEGWWNLWIRADRSGGVYNGADASALCGELEGEQLRLERYYSDTYDATCAAYTPSAETPLATGTVIDDMSSGTWGPIFDYQGAWHGFRTY